MHAFYCVKYKKPSLGYELESIFNNNVRLSLSLSLYIYIYLYIKKEKENKIKKRLKKTLKNAQHRRVEFSKKLK